MKNGIGVEGTNLADATSQSNFEAEEEVLLFSHDKKISFKGEKLLIDADEIVFKDEEMTVVLSLEEKRKIACARVREYYNKLLTKQHQNLVILTGAGSSVGVGEGGHSGKAMAQLWDHMHANPDFKLEHLCEKVGHNIHVKNLETLLSKANRAKDFVVDLEGIISVIQQEIKALCTLVLPSDSPHEIFLRKAVNRKLKYNRTKVFTLNYDTLFEQAAINNGFTIIDGFSFYQPRRFNGINFSYDIVLRENSRIKNEENFVRKVFHLYKLHGSVDWYKEGEIIKQLPYSAGLPLMIYPSESKYEHSYEQPYFEMMSRFQQALRGENVFMICIGFSFGDKHIVTVIKEALINNPSFQLLIVNKTIWPDDEWAWFKSKALHDSRITLIAETFSDFSNFYPEDLTTTQDERLTNVYSNG